MKINERIFAGELEAPWPAYQQVSARVRELVESGKLPAGARLPSTQQLAARWKVTPQTVHLGMVPLVKEGLLVRVPKRGTFVRQRAAKLTCVAVYDRAGSFRMSLFDQAVQAALKEELTAAGIEMDVWQDPRPETEQGQPWMPLVRAAERREFQALIALSATLPQLSWQQRLPVPTAFGASGDLPNTVDFDLAQFVELAVRALAAKGCRSVGLISPLATRSSDGRPATNPYCERFLEVSRDLGLTIRNSWMRLASHEAAAPARRHESYGYEQFLALWKQAERPAGLVVWPDSVARGVVMALLERGVSVPRDLQLALHKNEMVELFCPVPATFVVLREREIAAALFEQIKKQARGEECAPIQIGFHVESFRPKQA